jgi:endonuclease-3 related protein
MRLKAVAKWLIEQHGGDLNRALAGSLPEVRESLLAIPGIGPETADAILLYAGNRMTFVVDAYTRRMLRRHGYIDARASYDDVKQLIESEAPADATVYNEFHALIVAVGKVHCRARARCAGCPLEGFAHDETL